jgi:hypothetical protein
VDELKSIEENKTWSLTELPSSRCAIGLKWIYKVKKNQLGAKISGCLVIWSFQEVDQAISRD